MNKDLMMVIKNLFSGCYGCAANGPGTRRSLRMIKINLMTTFHKSIRDLNIAPHPATYIQMRYQ